MVCLKLDQYHNQESKKLKFTCFSQQDFQPFPLLEIHFPFVDMLIDRQRQKLF